MVQLERRKGSMAQRHNGRTAQRLNGATAQWKKGAKAQWRNGMVCHPASAGFRLSSCIRMTPSVTALRLSP
jgi:hypothetical protein